MIGVHLSRLVPRVLRPLCLESRGALRRRTASKKPGAVTLAARFAAALAVATTPSLAQDASPRPEPAARSPLVLLSIEVPPAHGLWQIVVTNHDHVPVRLAADARLLSLLVRQPADKAYVRCTLPTAMLGNARERQLVLNPGDSYVEPFDPRMFCWGDDADKLGPGASVTAFLGWSPDVRLEKRSKPQVPPFVVEPVLAPAAFVPAKQIASFTFWRPQGEGASPSGVREPPPRFVGAPDLRLSTPRWSDAVDHRAARISATLTNVGDRTALVHVRPDDLEVRVQRPDGSSTVCGPGTGYRAAVRDFFLTIQPGKSASVSSLLTELCPSGTFDRPGLYVLNTTLRVRDDGSAFRLQAVTGDFSSPKSTLLRVRSSRQPYHAAPPRPGRPQPPHHAK